MNRPTSTSRTTDWRGSLLAAVVATTGEFGRAGLTVDRVVSRAGTDRATFHSHFVDEQAAVKAAHEYLFECYLERLLQACKAQLRWPLKVKVGVGITLDTAAALPVDARFLVETMVGSWDFPGGVIDSRDRLARLLVPGRTETLHGPELPGVIEPALVGGIAGVISSQLRNGQANHLPALAPQLVELTLTPYLGREEAMEVARRPRSGPPDG
jgi:AcrR family transcriptional regulator